MSDLLKPELIVTHESDLDGFVSGLLLQRLAWKVFSTLVPIEAHHYYSWKLREPRERALWVSDFTFESRMDKPEWMIVDHHPTDQAPKSANLIHDPKKSASLLAYELCCEHGLKSEEFDRLVHLTNVGDLFLEDDPDFLEAADYGSLVRSYTFWPLHTLIEGRLERLLNHPLLEIMRAKRRLEDPLGTAWSRANIEEISPTVAHVDILIGNTNLIVHSLLKDPTVKHPVLLTLYRRSNGLVLVSLRSRNGEALKVATMLQGGGHPNACGATLPRSVKNIDDAVDYLKTVLNPTLRKEAPLNSLESLFESIERKK